MALQEEYFSHHTRGAIIMSSPQDHRTSGGRVEPWQRFTRTTCPVCGGRDGDKRGRGIRCYGYLSKDERFAFCTNADYAGTLEQHPHAIGSYKHLLLGVCDCGEEHGSIQPRAERTPATPKAPTRAHRRTTPTDIYDRYANGLRKLRYGSGKGKYFVWQHDAGGGDWIDGRDGREPGLYGADRLARADAWEPVYIPEGEGKVNALEAAGGVAVSPPDGAGSWRTDYRTHLAGRHVVILADADETGRDHAETVAADLASVAASVKILELDGAHDVADWLADGHTFAELLKITVCLSPAQHSNPAMQDGLTIQTLKTEIDNLRERLQIAETSLATLRREQAMAARIRALPNEKLAAPVKLAALAVRQVLTQPHARDDEGREQVYRAAIARQCGVSDQTAGTYLRKLEGAGIITREVKKTFDYSEIRIGEGPLFAQPEAIETPTRASTWGGKRVKGCPHCGSSDIVVTSYACRCCGSTLKPDDLIDVDWQEESQDNSLPPYPIVVNLASDDLVDVADGAPHCPMCGRSGADLNDYGDGLRCLVCDIPAQLAQAVRNT